MMDKLTPKQKKFADKYIETGNATEAAAESYDVANRNVAQSVGSENLAKPMIQIYLEEHVDKAKAMIFQLSQEANNEAVRLQASKDIIDRTHGKSQERIDHTTKGKELPTPILGGNSVFTDNGNQEDTQSQE